MKKAILVSALFLSVALSHGQRKQRLAGLSRQDSIGLRIFWEQLQTALQQKSKEKLAALCHFPFTCSQCVVDTTSRMIEPAYVAITKNKFNTALSAVFYEPHLAAYVGQHVMPRDLYVFTANNGTHGGYFFTYITATETSRHPGRQTLIYVKEISGVYKITATDRIP